MKANRTEAERELVTAVRRRELKARRLAMNLVAYDLVITNSKNERAAR